MALLFAFVKLFLEAFFIYLFVLSGDKLNLKFKIRDFLELLSFGLFYVCSAGLCNSFVSSIVCRFVFILCAFIWCSIREKNLQWKCVLGFSAVVSVFVEFGYLLSYRTVEFVDRLLKTVSIDLPAVVTQSVILCLYMVVLALIYKSRLINIKDIRILSSRKYALMFLMVCLGIVVYLRELLRTTSRYADFYDTLWCIVLAIIPVYVVSYVILSKISRSKNTDYNCSVDEVIEAGLEIPRCCAMFNIEPCSRTYESERVIFRKKLNSLNIDYGFRGYSQLILCLVMIRHFERKNTMDLKQDIFKCVSDFTKTNVDALYANFAKMIDTTWLNETTESLQYGYMTDDENIKLHIPTVEEFVLHLAQATV